MSRQLENKRALVTGGSRGIGAAIVRRLAREGAHVALTYVSNPEMAEETARVARISELSLWLSRPTAPMRGPWWRL